jgi:hypothetical protein
MPIFGQVWLWSSLAFLLGALLCWVLVALPARRRVAELESEFDRGYPRADRSGGRQLEDEYDDYRGDYDGYDRRRAPVDEAPEPLLRAYAQPRTREDQQLPERPRPSGLMAPPETDTTDTELADGPSASATRYLDVSSGSLGGGGGLEAPPEVPAQPGGRGWFDDEQPGTGEPLEAVPALRAPERDVRLVDDGADEGADERPGGTFFTQRTHPIPGELIRRIDEAGQAERLADEPADALVDDLAEDETGAHSLTRRERTAEPAPSPRHVATPSESGPGTEVISQPVAEPTPPLGALGQTEVMPAATAPPTEAAPASGRRSALTESRPAAAEPTVMPGVSVPDEPALNPLPKRVPGKPRGHTPFGVTLSKPEAGAGDTATATVTENEPARSLFEPIVPAEDSSALPPPHRVRGDGDGNGRGPFGPGSAMPLPGGASPSPEFTIKASVSAQRYCTPESPQFGSTVAEVWFKSSADAERVGFRPVG